MKLTPAISSAIATITTTSTTTTAVRVDIVWERERHNLE
jgi:hypothetical protein